ncbi:MAG TPA: UbiA-like polyprenyltransferase [Puia sp.]|nr:UbiA-like polyprenyltransferase [Puia sp.]
MSTVKNYLSLIKFSHTLFALPFAMIGFFLGIYHQEQFPDAGPLSFSVLLVKFVLVLFCMITARSAAMAFNRFMDRHFDAQNPRTAIREIPKGILAASSVLRFVIVCCLLFMLACWFINPLCFFLSPVALFVILFYSYTKRFTALCHLVLGVGLSLAPIGAFLAVTGHFAILPLLFSGAVICWVSGFDIIYALQDEEFDKTQHLYSIPASLGKKNALFVSSLLHVASALFVLAAGLQGDFGYWYWPGMLLFTGMLIYQHTIVKPQDLSRVNLAFMTANGIASVMFALFVIADIITHKH